MRWKTVGAATGVLALTFSLAFKAPESRASTPADCATSTQAPSYNSDTSAFEVGAAEQLIYLSQNYSATVTGVTGVAGSWREQDFFLTQSIDLEGCNFTPIGGSGAQFEFKGSFDGQGFAIDGLVSKGSSTRGLFGEIQGTIRHTVLRDVQISSDDDDAGAVAGAAYGSTIERIKASGAVSSPRFVGGIAGSMNNESVGRFLASTVAVSTVGSSTTDRLAGGVTGLLDTGSDIRNSYATGPVTGREAASLVGNSGSNAPEITFSFGTGSVIADTPGGLVAGVTEANNLSITSSFWDSEETGQESSAENEGSDRTTAQMTTASTFSAWNGGNGVSSWAEFDSSTDTIWGICQVVNDGYPYLLWEYSANPCLTQTEPESAATSSTPLTRADTTGIHLDAGVVLGEPARSSTILAEGEGLARGETFTLTLTPGSQTLASGVASRLGYFSTTATLPSTLTPGTYTLTLSSTNPAGNPLVLRESFSVDQNGLFTAALPSSDSPPRITAQLETSAESTDEASPTTTQVQPDSSTTETDEAANATETRQPAAIDTATSAGEKSLTGGTVPGWLVITSSAILLTLIFGGIALGIHRARQPRGR